jgi:anthranilate synthase/aminodeoxychorismate synthase-like glutamine amidotransferase
MLLMIDNYDSFTYNLVQYFRALGQELVVRRNDEVSIEAIESMQPRYIVISPGPSTPNEAGISMDAIRHFSGRIPLLGVCLGHQCIGQVFGGSIVHAASVMHGKTSDITHAGVGVFRGLSNPLRVTRYHSLAIDAASLPQCLEVTASTADGEIMGIRHRTFDVEGVQFHPEAILTEQGHELLRNFLETRRAPA